MLVIFAIPAFALCGLGVIANAGESSVRAVRLDGGTVVGHWRESTDIRELRLQTPDGEVVVSTDDLSSVAFEAAMTGSSPQPSRPPSSKGEQACLPCPLSRAAAGSSPEEPRGGVVFHLADGGCLCGAILRGATDAVVARTALGDSDTIAWDRLSGIQFSGGEQFHRAEQLFREALSDRLPGQDVLVSRDPVEVKKLDGRLESLDADGGSFMFAGESRKFKSDRVFGIVFAAGAKSAPLYPLTVELADGSVFSGTLQRADADGLRVAASVGATVDVHIADITALRFHGDRVVYVSDLKPVAEKVEGIVHAPWPVVRDKSVSGLPLSICGRKFAKGLGVHSRTELSYALNSGFERFAATIGIDDAVRPLGGVVMRVGGDSAVLFESGAIGGTDPPRDIIVDVSGVKILTLTVDYGDGLDVAGHADWGDARLIRPRASKPH